MWFTLKLQQLQLLNRLQSLFYNVVDDKVGSLYDQSPGWEGQLASNFPNFQTTCYILSNTFTFVILPDSLHGKKNIFTIHKFY